METLIRPQFVYNPDGNLDFTAGLKETYDPEGTDDETMERMVEVRTEHLDALQTFDSVEIEEDKDVATISVEVEKLLADLEPSEHERIALLIYHLNGLMTYHPSDEIDRVVGIDIMTDRGASVVVNQHFQRWMQSPDSFNEEVARRAVEAMALPFNTNGELAKDLGKDFRYQASEGYYFAGSSLMFGISVREDSWRISRRSRAREDEERDGEVNWFWPEIRTIGNCACWGVDGMDRGHTYLDEQTKRLYEMGPHNVDYAKQALSQLMALGVMTHAASQYEGKEDVFATVQWR